MTAYVERSSADVGHYGMRGGEGMPKHTITTIISRDFILSFLAFFGFLAAYHAPTPTLPFYVAKLGSHKREIGVLVGTIGVPSLVARLLVGTILLKYSEKVVMMW
jgi:hypothetical protein